MWILDYDNIVQAAVLLNQHSLSDRPYLQNRQAAVHAAGPYACSSGSPHYPDAARKDNGSVSVDPGLGFSRARHGIQNGKLAAKEMSMQALSELNGCQDVPKQPACFSLRKLCSGLWSRSAPPGGNKKNTAGPALRKSQCSQPTTHLRANFMSLVASPSLVCTPIKIVVVPLQHQLRKGTFQQDCLLKSCSQRQLHC